MRFRDAAFGFQSSGFSRNRANVAHLDGREPGRIGLGAVREGQLLHVLNEYGLTAAAGLEHNGCDTRAVGRLALNVTYQPRQEIDRVAAGAAVERVIAAAGQTEKDLVIIIAAV